MLTPPNPKLLHNAYFGLAPTIGLSLMKCSLSASLFSRVRTLSRFKVCGILSSFKEQIVNILSTAPAAPKRWPIAPLLLDMYSGLLLDLPGKSAEATARHSALSPSKVDVAVH